MSKWKRPDEDYQFHDNWNETIEDIREVSNEKLIKWDHAVSNVGDHESREVLDEVMEARGII